jgi:chromosome segregation ATPase
MALEVPELKRGFLGYKRSAVDRLIMEREELFVAAVKEKGEMSIRLDEARDEVAGLRTELAELKDEAEAGRAREVELEAQLDVARSRIDDLETERDELERHVAEQTALVRSCEGRIQVMKAELDSQKRMTEVAGERASRAEAQASERGEEREALRRHIDRVEAEARAAEQRADAARRALGDTEMQAMEARSELERLRVELARTSSQLEQAQLEAREAKDALVSRAEEPEHAPPSRGDVVVAVDAAEAAMDRIVHDHRRRAAEELELLERRQDQVRRETERLEARTNRMRAVRVRLGSSVHQARTRIEGVDEAIRAALEPLLDSLSALQRGMDELDDPPVVTGMASEHGTAEATVVATSPEDVADEDLSGIETDLLCWLPAAERRH